MRSKRSKRKPSYNTKKAERKSKGNEKRSLPGINKEKLAEILLPGELKVPAPIMEKSTRFFIIGGSIGVAGIIANEKGIISNNIFNSSLRLIGK